MSKEMKMSDAFVLPLLVSTTNPQMTTAKPSLNGKVDIHSATIRSPSESEITYAVHAINNHDRLVDEVEALREALRMKEAECKALAKDVSNIVSAAVNAHLSGSEGQHVDHLYRVIRDASGSLYSKGEEGSDENASL